MYKVIVSATCKIAILSFEHFFPCDEMTRGPAERRAAQPAAGAAKRRRQKDFVGLLITRSERDLEFGIHKHTDLVTL